MANQKHSVWGCLKQVLYFQNRSSLEEDCAMVIPHPEITKAVNVIEIIASAFGLFISKPSF